jgi:hypothetical protein
MLARVRLATLAATLASGAAAVSCSLDFDRYAAADAGPQSGGDAGSRDSGNEASAFCTALGSCLTQANSCAANCTQQYQRCTARCQGMTCMQNCTMQEQSCGGQCITTCDGCAQGAGCPATAQCLAAGTPQ